MLKNSWLPRMQRNVGLPSVSNTPPTILIPVLTFHSTMLIIQHATALRSKLKLVHSRLDRTHSVKYKTWSCMRTLTRWKPLNPADVFQNSAALKSASTIRIKPYAIGIILCSSQHQLNTSQRSYQAVKPNSTGGVLFWAQAVPSSARLATITDLEVIFFCGSYRKWLTVSLDCVVYKKTQFECCL